MGKQAGQGGGGEESGRALLLNTEQRIRDDPKTPLSVPGGIGMQHTVMQRVPQAAAPSRLLIRLTLWAGEREGRRHMARRASRDSAAPWGPRYGTWCPPPPPTNHLRAAVVLAPGGISGNRSN
ncbi:hypothetical protein EYF80_047579 [Liparis tanakae]|uniref:Uncharacterized protein n=1 Tax=Liparis tanakae TaxID=230148 RepID=A0A4Z2FM49_9TELE|nr:hypothetical protein EYF80_047579 [Liparis tanakae]